MTKLSKKQGIESEEKMQRAIRFKLFHNIIEHEALHPSLMEALDSMKPNQEAL